MNISPVELVVRCYAEKSGDQWQAFCLDLTLAAQADTLQEAKGKLEAMIHEYIDDALSGEDRPHAQELLSRKAPAYYWARYYWFMFLCKVISIRCGLRSFFNEPLPLRVDSPYNHA
ncbi:MAG TPA: hypothetical protein VGA00_04160 [Acidiferrobacterales bacterium]|jgi:predicted RNase H-like HicB family nuclease